MREKRIKGFTPAPIVERRPLPYEQLVRGFTLWELMVAAGILAFLLSGMLLVFVNCIFLNQSNRNLTIALSHSQFAMEEVKSASSLSVILASYPTGTCWSSANLTAKGLAPIDNESVCFSVSGTTLLDVVVTTSWKDRGVRDRSVSLETLITQP